MLLKLRKSYKIYAKVPRKSDKYAKNTLTQPAKLHTTNSVSPPSESPDMKCFSKVSSKAQLVVIPIVNT